MAPNRIIIDTDPGIDDVLAMLLAFSARNEELEVVMLSLTFGNVFVQDCLRNVVTLFSFIEKERKWRKEKGLAPGFETLNRIKPIVAVGATEPLAEQMMVADFFHGVDGLGGIHDSHPHFTPAETWKSLFRPAPESVASEEAAALQKVKDEHSLFTPSMKPAHEEMLQILRENEPDTITVVAIGPLTNIAIAAAADPEAFLRVKELVVMGGAVHVPGNPPDLTRHYSPEVLSLPIPNFNLTKQPDNPIRRSLNIQNQMTPGAEFNTYADSVAAARVFALTSPNPRATMPPTLPNASKDQLPPYPEKLSRQLKLKLFPLDITSPHMLYKPLYDRIIKDLHSSESPLTTWSNLFLQSTFRKMISLDSTLTPESTGVQLHDPLCIWYCMTLSDPKWEFTQAEDIRVESVGQWTRGCCIVERRGGRIVKERTGDVEDEIVGDAGGWGDTRRGNRIERCVQSPGFDAFAPWMLGRIYGLEG